MSKKNFRKTAAIGLAFIGLAGVGVASAATLTVAGDDNSLAQAGTGNLSISICQVSTINARYGLRDLSNNGAGHLNTGSVATFGYVSADDVLVLDGFDPACEDKTYEVAVGDSTGGLIAEAEGVVPAGGGAVTIEPGAWVLGPSAANLFDMARVSVTVYDTPNP